MVNSLDPTTLTSTELRHATARTRSNARTARTSERRKARRAKYAPQPFNAEQLLAELNAEGIVQ